jgi:hypothetical protein
MELKRNFPNIGNNSFNQGNNGIEGFILPTLITEVSNKIIDKLSEINESIKGMAEIIDDTSDDEDDGEYIRREQKEDEKIKREKEQNSILANILKGIKGLPGDIGNAGLGLLWDSKTSPFIGGGIGALGGAAAGIGMGALGIAGKVALLASVFGGIRGAFQAERISGSDVSGLQGIPKIIGAGLAGVIHALTFGVLKDEDVYKFMTTKVPVAVSAMYEETKKIVSEFMNDVDKDLERTFKQDYTKMRDYIYTNYQKAGLPSVWGALNNIADNLMFMKESVDDFVMDVLLTPLELAAKYGKGFGANGSNLPEVMPGEYAESRKSLLDAALKRKETGTGRCMAGVKDIIHASGLVGNMGRISGHADEAASILSRYGFDEIKAGDEEWLKNLGPGYAIAWGKDPNKEGDYGHASITLGGGQEMSDHKRPISDSIRDRGKFGYRVFIPPSDQFNTIDPNKKLSLTQAQKDELLKYSDPMNLFRSFPELNTQSSANEATKKAISNTIPDPIVRPREAPAQQQSPPIIINNNSQMMMPMDTKTGVDIEYFLLDKFLSKRWW